MQDESRLSGGLDQGGAELNQGFSGEYGVRRSPKWASGIYAVTFFVIFDAIL